MKKEKDWKYFGASVRGPGHILGKLPNQDAWLGKNYGFGTLTVVCDGMGSRRKSHHGSKEACLAVVEAIRFWSRFEHAPILSLLLLIHNLWEIRVSDVGKDESATTCLFVVAFKNHSLLMAQLGDGLCLLKQPGKAPVTLHKNNDDFSNETTALGVATSLKEWRYHFEAKVKAGTSVLLATDGISEDLLSGKDEAFMEFLKAEYSDMDPCIRWRRIAKDLRNWPTPLHSDDKTMALMWREPFQEKS